VSTWPAASPGTVNRPRARPVTGGVDPPWKPGSPQVQNRLAEGWLTVMAERFQFTLESVEASIVGQALDVDVRRFPLRIRNTTLDPVRFAKVATEVYRRLEQARLSVAGQLHPLVRKAFELLAEHRVSVSVTGIDGLGDDITVLAVTDGAQALEIGQAPEEDRLQFALFADEDLVDVLAGVLPSARAATTGEHVVEQRVQPRVSAMTARRHAEARADEEETDAFGNIELAGVVRARAAAEGRENHASGVLEQVLSGPRLGGGHILASGRGRRGEHLTAPPLSWLDTEDGRYLVWTEASKGDVLSARYSPAGPVDVAKGIRQVIGSVY